MKRASSILTFFHWLQKHGKQMWPFENDNISVYIGDFAMGKGFHEGFILLQACRFAHHVLQIDMSKVLNDAVLAGRTARLEAMKAATARARI